MIDYTQAQEELNVNLRKVEDDLQTGSATYGKAAFQGDLAILFSSNTQAFREVLIGCCLARILDSEVDVRLVYVNQGERSFNGRILDEKVVNPFLKEHEIPSSKGPYLAVFRRSVNLVPDTARGMRDKSGFVAMLRVLDVLGGSSREEAREILRHLLVEFVHLRNRATISLARINRLSLEQHLALVGRLLDVRSGGLIPVILSVAGMRSIDHIYGSGWEIAWQGINVADAASGAGGDITVLRDGKVLFAVEVTEREIDGARVRSTFASKISPQALQDYLFFYTLSPPSESAVSVAKAYFAQGHDINFLSVSDWLKTVLTTVRQDGRAHFTTAIIDLLDTADTPSKIKVAWNEAVRAIVSA
ncbi:MAG: restriction endonuclease, SacI family [Rhodobacter sp.]|nr:restriction endonuclease, SacI family [Rhodobacter sp.]